MNIMMSFLVFWREVPDVRNFSSSRRCEYLFYITEMKNKIKIYCGRPWGFLLRKLVTSLLLLNMHHAFCNNINLQTLSNHYSAKTLLSEKAKYLQVGMTREQVLKLLDVPTWAQSYRGMPLDWMWRNGDCNPVDVTFDERMRVNGFNEGRAVCFKTVYMDLPSNDFLCDQNHQNSKCNPHWHYDMAHIQEEVLGKKNHSSVLLALRLEQP